MKHVWVVREGRVKGRGRYWGPLTPDRRFSAPHGWIKNRSKAARYEENEDPWRAARGLRGRAVRLVPREGPEASDWNAAIEAAARAAESLGVMASGFDAARRIRALKRPS